MNRKSRRAIKKKMGADATDNVANKIAQFNKLPEQCSACSSEFDKKDKEMVNTWSVVVKQDVVRLFCPHCIKKAQEVIGGSY